MRSGGRTRLPTCVVKMREELFFMSTSLAPELGGSDSSAFRQCLELGPGDLGMADPCAQAAIRSRDHIVASDNARVLQQTLRYQFRMLDEITGVSDDTRNQDLSIG